MRRQLYRGGGIADLYPREKFGWGSKIKERFRKLIPNELADVAVKAAPLVAMVPGWGPAAAGIMRGVGRFDQRGSISDALKQGVGTWAGGELFGRGMEGMGWRDKGASTLREFINQPTKSRIGGMFGRGEAPVKGNPNYTGGDANVGNIIGAKGTELTKATGDFSLKGIMDKWNKLGPAAQTAIVGVGSGALAGVAQWFENQIPQEPGESMDEYIARRKVAVGKLMRQYMDNTRAFDAQWTAMTDEQKDAEVAKYNMNQGGRVGFQSGGTMMDITGGSPYLDDEGYFKYIDPDTSIDLQKEFDRRSQISNKLQSLYNLGFSTIPEFVNQYGDVRGKGDYSSKIDPNKVDQAEALLKKYSTADILPLLDPNSRYGRSSRTPEEEAKRLQEAREEYNFNVNPIIQYPQTTATPQASIGKFMQDQFKNPAPDVKQELIDKQMAAEPEGIQTIPGEKKVFNVMMDPKGNVMKDQGIAQLARDTGVAPDITNLPINSMSDVMRMIGPGESIAEGTGYGSIGMDRSLRENVAANEAQRRRVSGMFEAARSKLPGYGPAPIMPMQTNQYEKMFTNPGVVTQANPGGYRSEQEAIADLGIEKYNQLYNQGGRVGFSSGSGGLSEYEIFKLKELKYDVKKYGVKPFGGVKVLKEILKLHNYNKGGRVGLRHGTPEMGIKRLEAGASDITYEGNEGPQAPMKMASYDEALTLAFKMYKEKGGTMSIEEFADAWAKQNMSRGPVLPSSEDPINPFAPKPTGPVLPDKMMAAKGGRIGYRMGMGPAGLPGIPRQAPDGMEYDMRMNGGFQGLGAKEGKDDVPAMLAKNEFVFTADAVRGAGGGDIELGAQRMYDTMKNLERRVV